MSIRQFSLFSSIEKAFLRAKFKKEEEEKGGWACFHMPVIPATQGVETGDSQYEARQGVEGVSKILSQKQGGCGDACL